MVQTIMLGVIIIFLFAVLAYLQFSDLFLESTAGN